MKTISKTGYHAYLVGGFVRDSLLDRSGSDIDVCTDAPIDELIAIAKNYDQYEVSHHFGHVRFQMGGQAVEITVFRTERDYQDGRHPHEITFNVDLVTDVMRRDFTINALYFSLETGLIDPLNGRADLKQRLLRAIGDATQKFSEDHLRIVRLFRFQSQLGFAIEEDTLTSAQNLMHRIKDLKTMQWRDDFFKYLLGNHFLSSALKHPYFLADLLEPIQKTLDFDQKNPYHNYTLYEHTIRMVSYLPYRLDLRLAGLFHDLGKATTQVIDPEGIAHYQGHAEVSRSLAARFLDEFQLSKTVKRKVLWLIAHHDMPLSESSYSLRKLIGKHSLEAIEDLLIIKKSDNMAKSRKAKYQIERCIRIEKILKTLKETRAITHVSELAINGNDVIGCGFAAKDVKILMNYLLDLVMLEKAENTRESLLEQLERLA